MGCGFVKSIPEYENFSGMFAKYGEQSGNVYLLFIFLIFGGNFSTTSWKYGIIGVCEENLWIFVEKISKTCGKKISKKTCGYPLGIRKIIFPPYLGWNSFN